VLEPGRFAAPEDAAFDAAGNLYVVDAERDSLFVLTPGGRLVRGYRGEGAYRLRAPSGVSVYSRTVYIADRDNDRILRLRLSTDM
jgi:DNA-binding beta-propeller fold protein YncE